MFCRSASFSTNRYQIQFCAESSNPASFRLIPHVPGCIKSFSSPQEDTTFHRVAKFNLLCGVNRKAWCNECRYKSSYILRGSWLLSLPLPGAFICIKAGTYVNERILGTNYFLNKADVKIYSIGKLLDAASAAWRRQMRLHVSVESNGAESPA